MTDNDDLVLSLSIGGGSGASQTRRLSNPLQIHHSPLLPTSWDVLVASSMSDLPRRPEIVPLHKGMEASEEDEGGLSSPNSAVSSVVSGGGKRGEREELLASNGEENEAAGAFTRGISDDEDGGEGSRKKLRLSKEQSAVLEESFKEHNTLNPKQKIALAKQLNLRPRQVEVWFQNRRARTKLKQTEVDCELLKRCCESLTEENRRLQKEVQELRALKFSPQFYMHATPPTTLTMCPSCERVAISSSSSSSSSGNPVSDKLANLHRHLLTAAGGSQTLPWPPSSLRS